MKGGPPGRLAPYGALISTRIRMLLQYRAAALGGVWTQTFFGLVLIMIYDAFYRSSAPAVRPIALAQLVSYVWIGQALFAMLPWGVDGEMRALVRSGAVAYELCRPVDLYAWWYARALAQRTAPTVLRALPLVAIAGIGLPLVGLGAWRLSPPASLGAGLGFIAALALALALACAISVAVYASLMWTVVADGLVMMLSALVSLGSGLFVPLSLLPAWLAPVLRWLPFAGVLDLPARIYSGDLAAAEIGPGLARQLGWTLALVGFGRWLLRRGLRRAVVQGG